MSTNKSNNRSNKGPKSAPNQAALPSLDASLAALVAVGVDPAKVAALIPGQHREVTAPMVAAPKTSAPAAVLPFKQPATVIPDDKVTAALAARAAELESELAKIKSMQESAERDARLNAAYAEGNKLGQAFAVMTTALRDIINASEHSMTPAEVYDAVAARNVPGFAWRKSVKVTDESGKESSAYQWTDTKGVGVVAGLRTGDSVDDFTPISALLTSLFHCRQIVKTGEGAIGENAVRYWKVR